MGHIAALIIKFLMIGVVMGIVQGAWFGWTFSAILITTVLMTFISYIVGDLWILPKSNNITASSADFGISLIGIWVIGSLLFNQPFYGIGHLTSAFVAAIVIAVGEWFFHLYVMSKILHLSPKGAPLA